MAAGELDHCVGHPTNAGRPVVTQEARYRDEREPAEEHETKQP